MSSLDIDIRRYLLEQVRGFVKEAVALPGIRRIALVGSLTTGKPDPKDADVLVTIDDACDLKRLAAAGRRLKGHTQQRNHGADIFLADLSGNYIGRTCNWRQCEPFIRMACKAEHCGQRQYLMDDFSRVRLAHSLIATPPLVLWPTIVRNAELPSDVEAVVMALQADIKSKR